MKKSKNLVINDNVVLGGHVVSYVVINNETKQSIKKCQVNLLVKFLKARLKHYVTLSFSRVPHVTEIVDAYVQAKKDITLYYITVSDAAGSVLNRKTKPKCQKPNRLYLKTDRSSVFTFFLYFFCKSGYSVLLFFYLFLCKSVFLPTTT